MNAVWGEMGQEADRSRAEGSEFLTLPVEIKVRRNGKVRSAIAAKIISSFCVGFNKDLWLGCCKICASSLGSLCRCIFVLDS